MIWEYVLSVIIGYLLGSIPFALVIGKVFYKTDIRNYGSKNLGGGKAVATMYGFLFGMAVVGGYSIWIFFLPLIAFLIILYLGKIIALASAGSAIVVTLFVAFTQMSYWILGAVILFDILILWRHRANFERIKKGEENKISWM